MTSKERWRAAVARKPTDRITLDYWGTEEITGKLKRHLNLKTDDELWAKLGLDHPGWIGPEIRDPFAAERHGADLWWIKRSFIEHAGGVGSYEEVSHSPLAGMTTVDELKNFRWPDPAWYDYSTIPDQLAKLNGRPVMGGSFEPFYLYGGLRGIERSMEDVAERPEFLEYALQRIFEIHHEIIRRTLEAARGAVDLVYVAEDLGSQDSLLMSPAKIQEFFLPRMRKMADLVHAHGALAFHHDDGAIFRIIPLLLDAGIDILNPIQWRCKGMDRKALKQAFGDKVCFHGAMDNQQTLPFGSVEDVRKEVRENLEIFGTTGYILAPCHNLQSITPVSNVLAMYDEARNWKG